MNFAHKPQTKMKFAEPKPELDPYFKWLWFDTLLSSPTAKMLEKT